MNIRWLLFCGWCLHGMEKETLPDPKEDVRQKIILMLQEHRINWAFEQKAQLSKGGRTVIIECFPVGLIQEAVFCVEQEDGSIDRVKIKYGEPEKN